jgi:hypothetical protein
VTDVQTSVMDEKLAPVNDGREILHADSYLKDEQL